MKIKLSKSQWENMGKKAGWMKNLKTPKTHIEIAESQKLTKPCSANDIITVSEGLLCTNCFALTKDHGKTWEFAPENPNCSAEILTEMLKR